MINSSFEQISNLQYCLKNARREIQAFKSGEKYVQMEQAYKMMMRRYERQIRKLQCELAAAHRETIAVRNIWMQTCEDVLSEKEHEHLYMQKELEKMKKRVLQAEADLVKEKAKNAELRKHNYEVETALEEEKGKNLKLTAQLNRDYENSSIPSSQSRKAKKKIQNSRECSGRKPGGQPGHKGYKRKRQEPTNSVTLPPAEEILNDPDYKKTDKVIRKQMVGLRVLLNVDEYLADVYYNSKTGEYYHAPFPEGVVNEVNYEGSIKAFLYLLNNECCVSIDKCSRFLSDLTAGKLKISKGMINKLGKEFAEKTRTEQKELFARIQASPVMHTDFTNARENGKSAQVFVCATPHGEVMYFARQKKGHEGIKGTPVEDYFGILVHDHDLTFYSYGSDHQECLSHILRYLKDSMQNEPDRTWNKEMHKLLQEMIHEANQLEAGQKCSDIQISGFEKRYQDILAKAKEEYEYEPASKYYPDGYNLYKRLDKYSKNHLLFLHDPRIPHNNNEAERRLRNYKRKQKQAVSFRCFDSIDYFCQGMSMLVLMRQKEENVFDRTSEIFG